MNNTEGEEPTETISVNRDFGQRLKEERERLMRSQTTLSELLDVAKTTQSNYETGRRAPDILYLNAIDKLGMDALYVITGRRSHASVDGRFKLIKRYNGISASGGHGAESDDESHVSELAFSSQWLTKRGLHESKLCVISVSGESMASVLFDGDLILVNRADTQPRSGKPCVIRQGSELVVKYVQMIGAGKMRLSSENLAYPPYDIDLREESNIEIFGSVVCSNREW